MTRIILFVILIITLIMIFSHAPARAAMEPEEIMVRLATGLSLKSTAYERRRIRKARKAHKPYTEKG